MNIRRAIASDSDGIYELANQLHSTMSVGRDEFQHAFDKILSRAESACFVANMNGRSVGYVSGCLRPVLTQGGNAAYIDEIVVQTDMRGKNIGTALMAKFEEWALSEKCSLIGLATGGATRFYELLGYESKAGYFKKKLT